MGNLGNWILGAMTATMAIGGLFVSSRAGVGLAYYGGLAFFLFATGFIFHLIKVTYDHQKA